MSFFIVGSRSNHLNENGGILSQSVSALFYRLSMSPSKELLPFNPIHSGALVHAKERASGAPWVRKFGKLFIRENLVMTSAYSVRPYTLWG